LRNSGRFFGGSSSKSRLQDPRPKEGVEDRKRGCKEGDVGVGVVVVVVLVAFAPSFVHALLLKQACTLPATCKRTNPSKTRKRGRKALANSILMDEIEKGWR